MLINYILIKWLISCILRKPRTRLGTDLKKEECSDYIIDTHDLIIYYQCNMIIQERDFGEIHLRVNVCTSIVVAILFPLFQPEQCAGKYKLVANTMYVKQHWTMLVLQLGSKATCFAHHYWHTITCKGNNFWHLNAQLFKTLLKNSKHAW